MLYDVAIVGGGPAGLAAAIALRCEGWEVVLFEKSNGVGGQIGHSHLVENVVGYSRGFSGVQFSAEAYEQAVGLGVEILLGRQVMMLYGTAGNFSLVTPVPENTIHAKAILLTIGVAPKPLPFDVEGPQDLKGCNVTNELHLQPAQPGEHVIVYGGGNSAGQAATYYAKQGCTVTLLSRRPVEETMDGRWVVTMDGLGVNRVVGEIQHVDSDTVVFHSSGEQQELTPHTLHAFVGGQPITGWLPGLQVDSEGYIVTDRQHQTSTPGIFAAGDVEAGTVKRFTCAVGGGNEAVHSISRFLTELDASIQTVV